MANSALHWSTACREAERSQGVVQTWNRTELLRRMYIFDIGDSAVVFATLNGKKYLNITINVDKSSSLRWQECWFDLSLLMG